VVITDDVYYCGIVFSKTFVYCWQNVTSPPFVKFCVRCWCRLDLAIECFEKARRSRPLKPLQSLKDFRVIYDASGSKASTSDSGGRSPTTRGGGQTTQDRTKLQARRARSLSPAKDCSSTATSRDTARGGKTATTTTTAVPKSLSMYASQSGKEKKPLQDSGGVRADAAAAARQVPADTTRVRPGRRIRDSAVDPKDESAPDDASKALQTSTKAVPTDHLTRGKTASTSAKPNARGQSLSHGTSREPQQLQKRRAAADSADDKRGLSSRGS